MFVILKPPVVLARSRYGRPSHPTPEAAVLLRACIERWPHLRPRLLGGDGPIVELGDVQGDLISVERRRGWWVVYGIRSGRRAGVAHASSVTTALQAIGEAIQVLMKEER